MNDQKQVTQAPIKVTLNSVLGVQQIRGVEVPPPPDGCESQQVIDYAAVVSFFGITRQSNLPSTQQLRPLQVYAERWSIPVEYV